MTSTTKLASYMHVPSGSYKPTKTEIVVNFKLFIALCWLYDGNLRFANKEYTRRMSTLSNEYTQSKTQGGYVRRGGSRIFSMVGL